MKRSVVIGSLAALLLTQPLLGFCEEEETIDADDLFGGGGGYFHPYVKVTGLYDDNVYRTSTNEQSDYATVFSPGIWLALPGTREKVVTLDTTNLTPGGLGVVEDRGESFTRMRAFLHYGADITRYQELDDNDTENQRVDGLFQYNLKGGLTFEVLDTFRDGYEERGQGVSGNLDAYTSNLVGGRITYDLGSRFRVRGDYGHFNVDYDAVENQTRDRDDDKFAAYLYYKLSGKSSIFAEYDFVDIRYDEMSDLDSKEHYMWGGYRWRLSGKTMGEIKMGYLTKEYAVEEAENTSDFVVKGWLDYELTGKSRLHITGARISEEPDRYDSAAALTNEVHATLSHDLTGKINISANGGYARTTYEGDYSYRGTVGKREDDEYSGGLAIDYQIQRWLGVGASYTYFDRDSTFEDLSYTDNRFLLSLTLSM